MYKFTLIAFLILIATSCVSVQEVPNVVAVTQSHTRIAVLPIQATVERKIWMSQEKYLELNRLKSEETQQRVYRYLQFYSRNGSLHAEVMSPEEVNSMLHGAGYPNTNLNNNALCSLLHVDAIIYGQIQILEPISEAAAMAFSSMSNNNTTIITNIVELDLMLYDANSATQIWDSEQINRGQMGSIKENMQKQVCRRAVRNMPYNLKKNRYKKAYREMNGF